MIAVPLLICGWATPVWAQQPVVNASQKANPVQATHADVVLTWQGHTVWGDGDSTRCKSLQLSAHDQPMIGSCGGRLEAKKFFAGLEREWADVQNRYAPFTYTSAADRFVFRGRGTLAGPAWQRAVVAWAQSIYGYLYSGRISATGRNVLEWFYVNGLPGKTDKCGVLAVREIGDAIAFMLPCGQKSGTGVDTVESWLTTKEWEVFDNWLYHRARLEAGDNHFLGRGTQKMSQKEVAELSRWADSVYARLRTRK